MDHLINPESGTIGKFREQIKDKPSWSVLLWILGIMASLCFGSYIYVNMATASVKQDMKELNNYQDARIDAMEDDLRAMRADIQTAINTINEHRAYTEGSHFEKRKSK